jgi:hypothetical protein
MDEPHRCRVDAIAQSAALRRPVSEDVAEMAVGVRRAHLDASLAQIGRSFTLASSIGLVKLGQPLPESNLSDDANSGSPDTTST